MKNNLFQEFQCAGMEYNFSLELKLLRIVREQNLKIALLLNPRGNWTNYAFLESLFSREYESLSGSKKFMVTSPYLIIL